MPSIHKLRVFLCHESQDKPLVRELYQQLLATGWIDPWLDEEKLLPGQNWDNEIEKAVESTDAVIVCMSENSITKEGYIQTELSFAINLARTKPEESIFIIPLRLDDCKIPRRLRIWHYVDYFPENRKNMAFERLLKSLESRMESLQSALGELGSSDDNQHHDVSDDGGDFSLNEFSKLVFLVHSVSPPNFDLDGAERREIRVYIDSFSDRVLDEIERVEYHLHPSFPRPNRVIEDRKNRFELKTRGWGEFNLAADVYFRGSDEPVVLHRYINFPLTDYKN